MSTAVLTLLFQTATDWERAVTDLAASRAMSDEEVMSLAREMGALITRATDAVKAKKEQE